MSKNIREFNIESTIPEYKSTSEKKPGVQITCLICNRTTLIPIELFSSDPPLKIGETIKITINCPHCRQVSSLTRTCQVKQI